VKTTLTTEGTIDIPKEIREGDHLSSGDLFDLQRLGPGEYILKAEKKPARKPTIKTGPDGYPVFVGEGVITLEMVKEIESRGY
jgi:AbrB family looped-hinge helix DNA binding protein